MPDEIDDTLSDEAYDQNAELQQLPLVSAAIADAKREIADILVPLPGVATERVPMVTRFDSVAEAALNFRARVMVEELEADIEGREPDLKKLNLITYWQQLRTSVKAERAEHLVKLGTFGRTDKPKRPGWRERIFGAGRG